METASASDAELVDASRRGERAAFGELVERCARLVGAVSYAATRDRALSEDIAQDTFVAAWRDLGRLRDATALRPWLCKIARNLAHKARRRRVREVGSDEAAVLAADRTPFDAVAEREAEHVVTAALARVPDVYREALVLFYCEQRSAKDVAIALGLSEDVVNKRLSRGRRYLAQGVEQLVVNALERPRSRRDLAACVLAALPVALAVAPSDTEAATKGSSMWKLGALGIAAATVAAVGTVAAWSRPMEPRDRATRAQAAPHASSDAKTAIVARVVAVLPPPALPPTTTTAPAAAQLTQPITCATVARHMVEVLPGADDDSGQVASRFELLCRDESWSQRELACVLAAADALAAQACEAPRPLPAPRLAPPGTEIGCAAVADHMLAVSPPPAHDDRPEAQYASLHSHLEDICNREAWSEQRRRCTIVAPDGRVMARCLELDATPVPAIASVEAGCAAVGRHVADLVASDRRDVASVFGVSPETSTPELAGHIEAVCTDERWPEAHRRCLVAATLSAEIMRCQMTSK